jgi:hypothetical protein
MIEDLGGCTYEKEFGIVDNTSDDEMLSAEEAHRRALAGARRRLRELRGSQGDNAGSRLFVYAMEFGKILPELIEEEQGLHDRVVAEWIAVDPDDDPITVCALEKRVQRWFKTLQAKDTSIQAIMLVTDVIVSELIIRRTELNMAKLELGDPATKMCIRLIESQQRRRDQALRSLDKLHKHWPAATTPTHVNIGRANNGPNSAAEA